MLMQLKSYIFTLSSLLLLCSCQNDAPSTSSKVETLPAKTEVATLASSVDTPNPRVIVKTSMGEFEIELYTGLAPVTVTNFLQYVDDNFYDGTIFHRVIDNFMIQGGGMTPDMKEKSTRPPIKNEATNGVLNTRGTIAMARTMDVNSATAQFFINLVDNQFLNHSGTSAQEFGYCVFGKVVQGMEMVDKIKSVPTHDVSPHQIVPITPVIIQSIRRKR